MDTGKNKKEVEDYTNRIEACKNRDSHQSNENHNL